MVAEAAEGEKPCMEPWEQHSARITLPRFDYKASSSILDHSHSGFLITCTIKREISATKEAISILEKCNGSLGFKRFDPLDASVTAKKRKTCCGEDVDKDTREESKASSDGSCEGSTSSSAVENTALLSLVKLTRNGLLLFTFPKNGGFDSINVLSNIFESLKSKSLKPPHWCHRILPIQTTCRLNEKELQTAVTGLAQQYLDKQGNIFERPIRFAVGYNRRGIDDEAETRRQNTSCNANESSVLGRNQCFSIVAGAFHKVEADSVVDLKSPELAVLIELLPISGVPSGSPVAAVSILPRCLFTTKPRLCVKALAIDGRR